jgi:hypothetical protein
VEAALQFFIGAYNSDMSYTDDPLAIAKRYVGSLWGFWFDCATSIPWSYLDLHYYQASVCV